MTAAPTWQDAQTYLGDDTSATPEEIQDAFNTEQAAQARICTIPSHVDATDPLNPVTVIDYTDDLNEALYRRVAHNLALRGLPLGVAPMMTDTAITQARVGGTDAEVRRLEAPYRKLVVG